MGQARLALAVELEKGPAMAKSQLALAAGLEKNPAVSQARLLWLWNSRKTAGLEKNPATGQARLVLAAGLEGGPTESQYYEGGPAMAKGRLALAAALGGARRKLTLRGKLRHGQGSTDSGCRATWLRAGHALRAGGGSGGAEVSFIPWGLCGSPSTMALSF